MLALAFAAMAGDDWPMYLYDLAHSSSNAQEKKIDKSNVGTLEEGWRVSLSAPIAAAPTVVGGVVYVGAWDGNFHAIDAATGAKIWRTFVGMAADPGDPACQQAIGVTGQAVLVGDVVYVAGGDSAVYALDKAT